MSDPSTIQNWIQPLRIASFLADHWMKMPYYAPADPERLRYSENLLPELELPNLLEYALEPIKVWYRDGDTPVYSLELGRSEALHAYRAGLTLYFHLNKSVSTVLIRELSQELGRPPFTFRVSIFASRRGGETLPHVDGNENFTVQLRGAKRWRISAGEEYFEAQNLTQQERDMTNAVFRTRKPPDPWSHVHAYEMTPGAFVYCPAPYWHTVEALEDSLSLNVTIDTSYTWTDALLPAIRSALMAHPEWQSPDVGLWSKGASQKLARQTVQQLLARLSEDLRDISSDDLLSAWDFGNTASEPKSLPKTFVRNPFVSCDIVFANNDEFRLCIESKVRTSKKQFLTLDRKYYLPLLKLVSDRVPHKFDQVEDCGDLVRQLLDYGVLRDYNSTDDDP